MTMGEMVQKIYDVTYGNTPGKFTNGKTAGYNGSWGLGNKTSLALSGKEGLILIANAISGHSCTTASGSCELTTLANFGLEGYGSYGAYAYLTVYQYKNNKNCVVVFNGSYGNSGTFVALDLYY